MKVSIVSGRPNIAPIYHSCLYRYLSKAAQLKSPGATRLHRPSCFSSARSMLVPQGGLVVRLDPVDVTEGPEFGTGSASSADSGQFVLVGNL